MIKKILTLILFIALLSIPAQSFQEQNSVPHNKQNSGFIRQTDTSVAKKGIVNATNVNIRKGPSIKKQIVGKITNKGSFVDVIGYKGVWYKVRADGIEGWIHGDYIVLCEDRSERISDIFLADDIDSIRTTIYAWRDAWKSKNIDKYMSFYSPDFRSGTFDYQSWLDEKAKIFQRPSPISIEISDPDVSFDGKQAIAKFNQKYESLYHSDFGKKKLILAKRNVTWKIVSEEWEKLLESPHTISGKTDITDSKDKIIVKSIKFHIDKDRTEKVFIGLSHYCIPQIIALEGKNPRIAIDILNVSSWDEHYKIMPVKGHLIKQIRTHLHRNSETLRIVLDLDPVKNYTVNPIYYKAENIYCIEISDIY